MSVMVSPTAGQSRKIAWSDFTYTSERESSLRKCILPPEKFQLYGYRIEKYSKEELLFKYDSYCVRCNAFASKPSNDKDYQEGLKCFFHPGTKLEQEKIWTCCQKTTVKWPGVRDGCVHLPSHEWVHDSPLPRGFWDIHPTPPFQPSKNARSKVPRIAVSLDCEMATNRFNQPELIKLTLIDVFTKDVLIDSLVKPQAKVKNMLTMIHGVSFKDILSASKIGNIINGRDAAREKLFNFIGPETLVLVHGGRSDLVSLRWFHTNIVDTQEVEGRMQRTDDYELEDQLDREGNGLEALCRIMTGIKIRYLRNKHESLEDAMACRELAVWYTKNLKGEIKFEDPKTGTPELVNDSNGESLKPEQKEHTIGEARKKNGATGPGSLATNLQVITEETKPDANIFLEW